MGLKNTFINTSIMKSINFLLLVVISLIITSCEFSSSERAHYKKLIAENDSLRKALEPYDKQREEIISNSKGLILNGKISIQSIETGFYVSYSGGIFRPIIAMKFVNISGRDIKESVQIKGIFIDNKTGEQLDDDSAYLISYGDLFINGANKQIKLECSLGWNFLSEQDVSVRLYINDNILQTMKIKNEEFYGRI